MAPPGFRISVSVQIHWKSIIHSGHKDTKTAWCARHWLLHMPMKAASMHADESLRLPVLAPSTKKERKNLCIWQLAHLDLLVLT